jgi:hypothetical protein
MNNNLPPKVFISHAVEDKERFVTRFAQRLTDQGIDVWLDEWSMQPSDNLVQKIFEEGIKNSKTVIIVLSSISVNKPWVREELSASIVQKIKGEARIIPIVIEHCEIPISLQSILHIKIDDLNDLEDCINNVVSTVYNISKKPKIGPPPQHTQLKVIHIPGLTLLDSKILKLSCEVALARSEQWVDPTDFKQLLTKHQISETDAKESVEILKDRGLVSYVWEGYIPIPHFKITNHGFENYGKQYIPNFDRLYKDVIIAILNHNLTTLGPIADNLNQPVVIIEFLLDILSEKKFLTVSKCFGDIRESINITDVTALGRRFAKQ